jgi:hypothetical protein
VRESAVSIVAAVCRLKSHRTGPLAMTFRVALISDVHALPAASRPDQPSWAQRVGLLRFPGFMMLGNTVKVRVSASKAERGRAARDDAPSRKRPGLGTQDFRFSLSAWRHPTSRCTVIWAF